MADSAVGSVLVLESLGVPAVCECHSGKLHASSPCANTDTKMSLCLNFLGLIWLVRPVYVQSSMCRKNVACSQMDRSLALGCVGYLLLQVLDLLGHKQLYRMVYAPTSRKRTCSSSALPTGSSRVAGCGSRGIASGCGTLKGSSR